MPLLKDMTWPDLGEWSAHTSVIEIQLPEESCPCVRPGSLESCG